MRLGWATVTLLVGLVIGWWAGSFTTACDPEDCQANAGAIEAAGTWVGGLGTVAAVLFAVRAFRSEEQARRDEQVTRLLQMQQEQEAKSERMLAAQREQDRIRAEANTVIGIVGRAVSDHVQVRSIQVTVWNNANETPVFKVGGQLPGYGTLKMAHRVESGKNVPMAFFGNPFALRAGNLPRAIPRKERPNFYADLTKTLILTYEMNGHQWKRVGNGDAELMS